jgi:hypothetical protein
MRIIRHGNIERFTTTSVVSTDSFKAFYAAKVNGTTLDPSEMVSVGQAASKRPIATDARRTPSASTAAAPKSIECTAAQPGIAAATIADGGASGGVSARKARRAAPRAARAEASCRQLVKGSRQRRVRGQTA